MTPTLPIYLRLDLARPALVVDETLTVTMTVYATVVANQERLQLILDLPNGLATTNGGSGKLRWTVPTLAPGEAFVQSVQVQVDKAKKALHQGLVRLEATADLQGHRRVQERKVLGIVPAATTTAGVQGSDGTALWQQAEGVTLLVPPGAAPAGVTFQYNGRFHGKQNKGRQPVAATVALTATTALSTSTPLSATSNLTATVALSTAAPLSVTSSLSQTVVLTPSVGLTTSSNLTITSAVTTTTTISANRNNVYLPVVQGALASTLPVAIRTPLDNPLPEPEQPVPSTALTATTPISALTVITEEGYTFYQQWTLTALQGEQPITEFAEPLTLQVDASWLVAAGIDPTTLLLLTRADASQPWRETEAAYEASRGLLVAEISHFSDWGLASGLNYSGDFLPTAKGFASDRHTGGATVNYPIAAPKGLGGLAPNLSLNYSSLSVDDTLLTSGNEAYGNQASTVGYGWSLGGLSSIDRSETSPDQEFYTLVLNGARFNIRGGTSNPQLDPVSFATIQYLTSYPGYSNFNGWLVTTPDGVKYLFGGEDLPATWANTTPTLNTPLSKLWGKTAGGSHVRKFNKWHLSEVVDPLGNFIKFKYMAERDEISSGCINDLHTQNQYLWYTRAVLPTEIIWSGNTGGVTSGSALSERLHVLFTYAGDSAYGASGNRADVYSNWASIDCNQVHYTNRRLSEIKVEVWDKDNSAWHTLHKYVLNQTYDNLYDSPYMAGYPDSSNLSRHMLLLDIQHYGKEGTGLVEQYTFTYDRFFGARGQGDDPNRTRNNVRLITADNGAGGKITYEYTKRAVEYCSTDCPPGTYRYPVTRTYLDDGLGNRVRSDFGYGTLLMRAEKDANNQKRYVDFLGFRTANATTYEIYPASSPTSNVVKFEEFEFHQTSNPTDASSALDPLHGKRKQHKVWSAGPTLGSGCQSWQGALTNGRCQLADNQYAWSGWIRSGANSWVTAPGGTQAAVWEQQNSITQWLDGATTKQEFLFAPAQQNGSQYGNITHVKEYDNTTLKRTTVTEYYPNSAKNIVNVPARVRIYKGSDSAANCKSQVRMTYLDPAAAAQNRYGNYQVAPATSLVARTDKQYGGTSCIDSQAAPDNSATVFWNSDWVDNWQVTFFAYDEWGNQTMTRQAGNTTSSDDYTYTDYDGYYHLFPVRRRKTTDVNTLYRETAAYYGVNGNGTNGGYGTNSAALSNSKAYWGAMAEHCGVNDVCTRQSYDSWGRPTFQWTRQSTGTSWGSLSNSNATTRWKYYDPKNNNGYQSTVVIEWHAPHCEGNFVRRHYNGLGQLVVEQKPDQYWTLTSSSDGCNLGNNLNEIDVGYTYNALGHPNKVSVPLRTTATWTNRFVGFASSTPRTTTNYDALGRPTDSTSPNGEVTYTTYNGRTTGSYTRDRAKATNQTDAYKVVKWQTLNSLGQLQNVYNRQWTGSTWNTTAQEDLTHDVLGNLTNANHAGGVGSTDLTYDVAGLKISMNDVDLGSWNYVYNRQGKLVKQTDGRGNIICLYYDTLGRLSDKRLYAPTTCPTDYSGAQISFRYDGGHSSSNRSRGQLTTIYYYDGTNYLKQIAYDSQGRLEQETVTITGAPQGYVTRYGYDSYHRPTTVTYPDGEIVTTSYNSMGLPSALYSDPAGTSNDGYLVDNVSYDELGRLRNQRYPLGGNLWRSQVYHPWSSTDGNSNRRLNYIGIGTAADSFNVLDYSYRYDSFGNVTGWYDNATWNYFTYDSQNRLTSAYGKNYSYDAAGRLTTYEGVNYTSHGGHTVTRIANTDAYFYGNSGNMVTRDVDGLPGGAAQTLTWRVDNTLASVSGGGYPTESYFYDSDGQRVLRTSNGVSTYYPNQFYEQSGSTVIKYYYFNGQRIAQRNSGTLYYLHNDHLGGMALTTSSAGNSTLKYYAYGRRRAESGSHPTRRQYTGQYIDDTGLYYYNARYYDPHLGTFISPDTLVPDPTNLFDYNRYMYTRGNPLKYNDPSGHWVSTAIGGAVGFGAGVGMYLWNEQHQDGFELSVDVSWDGWTPSVDLGDLGDAMTAGLMGGAAGALIATPGMTGVGASMAGNLLAEHFSNGIKGEDFSSQSHMLNGGLGAATGGYGKLVDNVVREGGASLVQGMLAKSIAGIGSDSTMDFVKGEFTQQKLMENTAFNLGGETLAAGLGKVGTLLNNNDVFQDAWETQILLVWKHMETAARYVVEGTQAE